MKVLYIFDEDDKYGAAKAGIEMISSLKENYNITPIVITSQQNDINSFCDKNNIENYYTKHHKFTYAKSSSIIRNMIKFIPRYIRYILGNIYALNYIDKHISTETIDLIHANNSGLDLGILISKKYNIPNIIHLREYGVGKTKFNVKSYRNNYIKFLNKNTNQFIAISNSVKDFWISKGLDKNKIVVIYDGVNVENIKVKDQWFINDKINMTIVGSISEGKGQLELLDAISSLDKKILSKIQLDIIGSGQLIDEKNVINKIDKLNLNKVVHFLGYKKNINNSLKQYDIGIVCSDGEGFGRVTVEYMTAGLCVIASDKGANTEIIMDNNNGIIYHKNIPNNLTQKIAFCINNREKIKKIGTNARSVSTKYSVSKNIYSIEKLYKQLQNK